MPFSKSHGQGPRCDGSGVSLFKSSGLVFPDSSKGFLTKHESGSGVSPLHESAILQSRNSRKPVSLPDAFAAFGGSGHVQILGFDAPGESINIPDGKFLVHDHGRVRSAPSSSCVSVVSGLQGTSQCMQFYQNVQKSNISSLFFASQPSELGWNGVNCSQEGDCIARELLAEHRVLVSSNDVMGKDTKRNKRTDVDGDDVPYKKVENEKNVDSSGLFRSVQSFYARVPIGGGTPSCKHDHANVSTNALPVSCTCSRPWHPSCQSAQACEGSIVG